MLAAGSPRLTSASRVRHFIKLVLKALYLHVFPQRVQKNFLTYLGVELLRESLPRRTVPEEQRVSQIAAKSVESFKKRQGSITKTPSLTRAFYYPKKAGYPEFGSEENPTRH